MSAHEIKDLRKMLREHFGKRRYKITKDGEIHGYGPMINANGKVGILSDGLRMA
jgi:hypothetical protein